MLRFSVAPPSLLKDGNSSSYTNHHHNFNFDFNNFNFPYSHSIPRFRDLPHATSKVPLHSLCRAWERGSRLRWPHGGQDRWGSACLKSCNVRFVTWDLANFVDDLMHQHGRFFNCVTLTLIFAESFDSSKKNISGTRSQRLWLGSCLRTIWKWWANLCWDEQGSGDPQHEWARESSPKKSPKRLVIVKLSLMNSIRKRPDILDEVLSVDGYCWFGRSKTQRGPTVLATQSENLIFSLQEAKNAISHRGRALQLLRSWLVSNAETFAKEVQ